MPCPVVEVSFSHPQRSHRLFSERRELVVKSACTVLPPYVSIEGDDQVVAAGELSDAPSECGVRESGAEYRSRATACTSCAERVGNAFAYEQDTVADARSRRLHECDARKRCHGVGGVVVLATGSVGVEVTRLEVARLTGIAEHRKDDGRSSSR